MARESLASKRERAAAVEERMFAHYGPGKASLDYTTPFLLARDSRAMARPFRRRCRVPALRPTVLKGVAGRSMAAIVAQTTLARRGKRRVCTACAGALPQKGRATTAQRCPPERAEPARAAIAAGGCR